MDSLAEVCMRERNYGTVKKTARGWQKQMWFSRDEKHQLSLRRMCPQPNPPNNLLEQARTRLCTLLIKCEYCLWMISVMQKLSVIECERIMFMFLLYMSECKAYIMYAMLLYFFFLLILHIYSKHAYTVCNLIVVNSRYSGVCGQVLLHLPKGL